jgi:hypothetical protein
VVPF